MRDPSSDNRFQHLARLVGHALAKRWVQLLNRKAPKDGGPSARNGRRPRRRRPRDASGTGTVS